MMLLAFVKVQLPRNDENMKNIQIKGWKSFIESSAYK